MNSQKTHDLLIFSKILNSAINSKLPLPKFLVEINNFLPDSRLKELIENISNLLAQGKQLHEVLNSMNIITGNSNSDAANFLLNLLLISDTSNFKKSLVIYIKHYIINMNLSQKLRQVLLSPVITFWLLLANIIVANFTFFPRLSEIIIEKKLNYSIVLKMLYFVETSTWPWSLIFVIFLLISIMKISRILITNNYLKFYNSYFGKVIKLHKFIEYEELARIYKFLACLLTSKVDLVKALEFIYFYSNSKVFTSDIYQTYLKLKNGINLESVSSESIILKPLATGCLISNDYDTIVANINSLSDVYYTLAENQLEIIKIRAYIIVTIIISLLVLLFSLSIFGPYFNLLNWEDINVQFLQQ